MYPPVSRVCEPPAALGRIGAYMKAAGHECILIDGNVEALSFMLDGEPSADDTWTRRAFTNRQKHIEELCSPSGYRSIASYSRAVHDLSRVLARNSMLDSRFTVGLADYRDSVLSPVSSADLQHSFDSYRDNPFYPWFSPRIAQAVEVEMARYPENPRLGFSLSYLSQALTVFAMAGFVKSGYPSVRIVIGGGLMRSWGDSPVFTRLCDDLGILPWADTAEAYVETSESQGRSGENVCCIPDYGFTTGRRYLAPGAILPYSGSLGCSYRRCAFCTETWEGLDYSDPGPAQTFHGYRSLAENGKPVLIHFCDNEMSPGLLALLAAEKGAGKNCRWYGFSRILPRFSDPAFCHNLASSGCAMLCLGIESGSQAVLDRMRKGIRLNTVVSALKNLHAAGIATFCYFLFGTPWENRSEAEETLAFLRDNHENIDYLNLSIFNLPRKSPDTAVLSVTPFYEGDLSLYMSFRHPAGWDRGLVRDFISGEVRSAPEISGIMSKTPPVFTSSHAPFFSVAERFE